MLCLASSTPQVVSLSGYSLVFMPFSLTFVQKGLVWFCAHYCQATRICIRLMCFYELVLATSCALDHILFTLLFTATSLVKGSPASTLYQWQHLSLAFCSGASFLPCLKIPSGNHSAILKQVQSWKFKVMNTTPLHPCPHNSWPMGKDSWWIVSPRPSGGQLWGVFSTFSQSAPWRMEP